MATHTSTRRNILGAIAGVPVAATFGTIALPAMASDRSAWAAALANYATAWQQLEDHPASKMLSTDPGYDEVHEDESRYVARVMASERAIRDTPAPDYRAVIEKLELHLRNYGEDTDTEGLVASSIADIRRLAAH